MIKKLAGLMLFLLLVFLLVEMSYRAYVLGPVAFQPARLNSMTTLMRSEYVQLSQYPDIFFELKPNMHGWYKGLRFWTNSHGNADREYNLVKPPDTYRIAVTGSSWEMPSGVEPDKAWHALIEDSLTSGADAPVFEVINFGVEMYGLREILGTIRHKVLEWDPDLILVAVTPYTMSLIWEPDDAPQALPARAYPALDSYAYLAAQKLLGFKGDPPANDRKRFADDAEAPEKAEQLQRAIRELGEIRARAGVPVVIVFLGFYPLPDSFRADISKHVQQAGVSAIFADGIFPQDFRAMERYQVSLFDRHPNEAGHALIAEYLRNELLKRELVSIR